MSHRHPEAYEIKAQLLLQEVQEASEALVVRSLRRRFYRALSSSSVDPDGEPAARIWCAQRSDWEAWRREEIYLELEEERQRHEERKKKHRPFLRKLLPQASPASTASTAEEDRGGAPKKTPRPLQRSGSGDSSNTAPLSLIQASSSDSQETKNSTLSCNHHYSSQHDSRPQGTLRPLGLLQIHMHPIKPFVLDDYRHPIDDPYPDLDAPLESNDPHRKMNSKKDTASHHQRQGSQPNRPTLAFWMMRPRSAGDAAAAAAASLSSELHLGDKMDKVPADVDPRTTTPLHEAARLGNAQLFRLLLQGSTGISINARNGLGRTVLHMAAGGVEPISIAAMQPETTTRPISTVGIPPPLTLMELVATSNRNDAHAEPLAHAKKAARAVQRFLRGDAGRAPSPPRGVSADSTTGTLQPPCQARGEGKEKLDSDQEHARPPSAKELQMKRCAQDRLDTILALLAWSHPDDGSEYAGDGVSVNSVDSRGRTALHYAAELGREEICMAIVSSFGAMMTIVDDRGQTPCELAAEGHYDALAAQLEARALLYIDPYGMDEELMSTSVNNRRISNDAGYRRSTLVPPFSWFDTWNWQKTERERESRVNKALDKIKTLVERKQASAHARATLRSLSVPPCVHGDDHSAEEEETKPPATNRAEAGPLRAEDDGHDTSDMEERSVHSTSSNSTASAGKGTDSVDLSMFSNLHKSYMETFLSHHQWNVRHAVRAFNRNPIQAFLDAGITLPSETKSESKAQQSQHETCLICCEEFDAASTEWRQLSSCDHGFCKECLGDYVNSCAKAKTGLAVTCPHHECNLLLTPLEVAELAPSSDIYEALLNASNENFVASASDLKFCPHPSCPGVVRYIIPDFVKKASVSTVDLLEIVGGVCTAVNQMDASKPLTYEGVYDPDYYDAFSSNQPLGAHRFCFHCGDLRFHWPVTCERLAEWKLAVTEHVKEVSGDDGSGENYKDVAQQLWMKANTRPCPKCKAPIEKNEGCNHMICSNPSCLYEFCWICRNDWKLHNTDTGGFFRCNRWADEKGHQYYDKPPEQPDSILNLTAEDLSDPATMRATYGTAMHEARVSRTRSREMDRFLHHYERFNAHAESAALEQKMAATVRTRFAPVVKAAVEFLGSSDFLFRGKGLSFIHAAFTELLECRSMLQYSYAFSYFRYISSAVKTFRMMGRRLGEKAVFEKIQAELEMMTEQMSDVVARSHIRATQAQISFLTVAAADKRKEFSNLMINLLVEEKREAEGEKLHEAKPRPRVVVSMMDTITGLASSSGDSTPDSDARVVRGPDALEEAAATLEAALRESLEHFMSTAERHGRESSSSQEEAGEWACAACTFVNSGGRQCAICDTSR